MVNNQNQFIEIQNLEVYKLSREYSKVGWEIYNSLSWQDKKITGDQFIKSIDSVGANIAEGYGRYHYLDKIKFYYNSRGSLVESKHWLDLLLERKLTNKEKYQLMIDLFNKIFIKLNALIKSQYKSKSS